MVGTASVRAGHGLRRLALALGAIVVLCLALAAKAPAAYVGATDAAAPASITNGGSTGYTLDFEGTTVARTTPTDVVLVLDESGSIAAADFAREKSFAQSVVNSLDVFSHGGSVGVVQFSSDARQTLPPSFNKQSALNAISGMYQRGGQTCIGCGIQGAHQMFQTLGNGRKRVQIVLTDGVNNVNTGTFGSVLATAKGAGEELFAIGVGSSTDPAQLAAIASEPDSTHLFNVSQFSGLDAILQQLVAAVVEPAETNITWAFDVADAFAASNVQVTKGSVTVAGTKLTWTIPALAAETARLSFTATHQTAAGCGDLYVLNSSVYQSAQNSTKPVLTRGPVTVTGCDQTKPTATITAPVDGAKIPQGDDVKAAYACADEQGGSGVDTCVGDVADGASIDTAALGTKTFSVVATDKAGNTHTETVSYEVVDVTKPTATITAPVDGAKIPQGDAVTAAFSCADEADGSGIDTCVGDVADGQAVDTATLGTKTFSVVATDKAGNTHTGTVSYEVVDVTKPTAAITSPADGATYARGQDVKAAYSCQDEAQGSGVDTCVGDVADGASIETATLGTKAFSVVATDKAGNTHTETVHYEVVDVTNPTITLRTPVDGAAYAIGQDVKADYACDDEAAGSGLATCTGDVASGAAIDTSKSGTHTFTVQATDKAGNTATTTVTYTVKTTPAALCALTVKYLKSSAKYQALTARQKQAADALAERSCRLLEAITPKLPAFGKTMLVVAYKVSVNALVPGGWLTKAQAAELSKLADQL